MIGALVSVGVLFAVFALGALFGAAITEANQRAGAMAKARHPAGRLLTAVEATSPPRRPR